MTLESVVVSRDWPEISVLECILSSLHIGVNITPDPEKARTKLSKTKVDAVIIDRDLSGTEGLVGSVRCLRYNGSSVPLVLLSGSPGRHDLSASGANFFFEKPISVEQAVRTLSAARNMILNGRLRYYRQAVDVPVSLSFGGRKKLKVQLANLSQGGIGIRALRSIPLNSPLQVRFGLPGMKGAVQAKGELAWSDAKGHAGIRFLEIAEPTQRRLQLWLETQYFGD